MVEKRQKPMDRHHMKRVLTRVGSGQLRKLSQKQKSEMEWLRKRGMLVSALVGLMCTIVPAATENYLCWHWEIDGFKDAYWKCHVQSALGVRNETGGNYSTLEYRYEQMKARTKYHGEFTGEQEFAPTKMDPDVFLCTTTHVNISSCELTGGVLVKNAGSSEDPHIIQWPDGETALKPDRNEPVGSALRDVEYYPNGLNTHPHEQEGWATVTFDPLIEQTTDQVSSTVNDQLAEDGDAAAAAAAAAAATVKFDNRIAGICSRCECAVCACIHNTNGQLLTGTDSAMYGWWTLLVIVIVANILVEIPGLMYVALAYSTDVARVLDIRLSPLNADRAFVADSLVRAAFELGNPDSPVLGVDPGAASTGQWKQAIMMVLYKLKVVGTGLFLKFLIGLATPPEFGLWAKPWLGMVVATILWDGLIAYVIIMQAQIRGMGVFVSVSDHRGPLEELACLPACLLACLPACLPACLLACLCVSLAACLSRSLAACCLLVRWSCSTM